MRVRKLATMLIGALLVAACSYEVIEINGQPYARKKLIFPDNHQTRESIALLKTVAMAGGETLLFDPTVDHVYVTAPCTDTNVSDGGRCSSSSSLDWQYADDGSESNANLWIRLATDTMPHLGRSQEISGNHEDALRYFETALSILTILQEHDLEDPSFLAYHTEELAQDVQRLKDVVNNEVNEASDQIDQINQEVTDLEDAGATDVINDIEDASEALGGLDCTLYENMYSPDCY